MNLRLEPTEAFFEAGDPFDWLCALGPGDDLRLPLCSSIYYYACILCFSSLRDDDVVALTNQ